MTYSIALLLFFFIIQVFAINAKFHIKKDLSYYYILFLSFIILNLFRIYSQSIFGDIPNYKILFETINPISSKINFENIESDVEIGFMIFISIFKFFSSNFGLFLFFISTIQLLIFYIFCKRYKINLFNALPIYVSLTYTTFQIGMLRQALAFCFFLLGLVYINRKIVYIMFILLGFTFHRSILFVILLTWSDKFINRKILYIVIFSSLILYLSETDLINYYLPYLGIEDSNIEGRVNFYLDLDRANNYLGIGFWERIILLVLMNLAYVDLLRKNKVNKYYNLIYNLGISVILLQMIFFSSPTITSRLRYYVVIFPVIFLTEYIHSDQKNRLKWFYQSFLFMYLLLYLYFQVTYLT